MFEEHKDIKIAEEEFHALFGKGTKPEFEAYLNAFLETYRNNKSKSVGLHETSKIQMASGSLRGPNEITKFGKQGINNCRKRAARFESDFSTYNSIKRAEFYGYTFGEVISNFEFLLSDKLFDHTALNETVGLNVLEDIRATVLYILKVEPKVNLKSLGNRLRKIAVAKKPSLSKLDFLNKFTAIFG